MSVFSLRLSDPIRSRAVAYSEAVGISLNALFSTAIAAYLKNRSVPLFPPLEKTIGRNALCLCGSGKKYKRCCGAS